jgi:hypothetical protein
MLTFSVMVPPEFVEFLGPGEHGFEVLTIEEGGNQTITAGSFVKEAALKTGVASSPP